MWIYIHIQGQPRELFFLGIVVCSFSLGLLDLKNYWSNSHLLVWIIVKTDNVGAIFMVQNASSGVRTCHVDTWYHFVRENLEEGIIKIKFIENESDIFTKNITQEICEKYVKKFLEERIEGEHNDWTFWHRKWIGNIPHVQVN